MHHYERVEISDFTPGIVTAGEWLVPAKGSAEMLDCYPQIGGGLRAWTSFAEFSKAGIGASEFPFGFYARGAIPVRSGAALDATDLYIITYNSSDGKPRLYRWDNTNDAAPPAAWTLIKTFAASTAPGSPPSLASFQPYVVAGTTHVYLILKYVSGTDQGLWRIRYSDGALTQITTHANPRCLVAHQDRLLYGHGSSEGSRLVWNDPNTETFGAASFIDVLPYYRLTSNSLIKSFVGDLLIGKTGAPWTLVQGPITDPTVRTMLDAAYPVVIQAAAETPDGLAYSTFRDGQFLTSSGSESKKLTDQLLATDVAGDGLLATSADAGVNSYASHFLTTPSGYIWDRTTESWFRTSHWGAGGAQTEGKYQTYDAQQDNQILYVVTRGTAFKIFYSRLAEGSFTRKRAYTWRSAPLRDPNGRQITIREIDITLKSYLNGATATITVGNTTHPVAGTQVSAATGIAAGRQQIHRQFEAIGEVLDVQVVVDSGADGTEAPSIEAIGISSLPGHLLT